MQNEGKLGLSNVARWQKVGQGNEKSGTTVSQSGHIQIFTFFFNPNKIYTWLHKINELLLSYNNFVPPVAKKSCSQSW